MVSRKKHKGDAQSRERIRNQIKTTHPAGNLYGHNVGETKETWKYERKKRSSLLPVALERNPLYP